MPASPVLGDCAYFQAENPWSALIGTCAANGEHRGPPSSPSLQQLLLSSLVAAAALIAALAAIAESTIRAMT